MVLSFFMYRHRWCLDSRPTSLAWTAEDDVWQMYGRLTFCDFIRIRVQSLPARRCHCVDLEMVPGLIVLGFVPPCWHRNGTSAEIYEVLNCLGVLRQTSDKHSRSLRKTLPGFSMQVEMGGKFWFSVSRAMPMIKKAFFFFFFYTTAV